MRSLCAYCLLAAGNACAAVYPLPEPGNDLIGETRSIVARDGDNLATLAYEHRLGFRQVLYANPGVDPWSLREGQPIELPTQMLLPPTAREGIVINVPEMRLYYFPAGERTVHVYPVAVGRVDWKTPLGTTQIREKVEKPVWYPPESIREEHAAKGDPLPPAVLPGPDNPLGEYAMRLGWRLVLIHGTNMPLGGIGMPVTHGCLRLYPEDIESLYKDVAIGTTVTIVDQPYKLGRHDGRWHLEAHALLSDSAHARRTPSIAPALVKMKRQVGERSGAPDWARVAEVLKRSDGMPALVEPVAAARPVALAVQPAALRQQSPPPVTKPGRGREAEKRIAPIWLLAAGGLVVLGLLAGIFRRLDRRDLRR